MAEVRDQDARHRSGVNLRRGTRRTIVTVLAAVAGLGITASVAQADYFITKKRAESFTRDAFHERYGEADGALGTFCRPQGRSAPKRGYIYHRWACTWADDLDWGRILIIGSSEGRDYYYSKVVQRPTSQ